MENLKELLSDENIKKHKGILATIVAVVVMSIGAALLAGQLIKSYQAAEAVKTERIKMAEEMQEFLTQKKSLEMQSLQPVSIDKVDSTQSQIVVRLISSKLNLLNYKASNKENVVKDKFAGRL